MKNCVLDILYGAATLSFFSEAKNPVAAETRMTIEYTK